MKIIVSVKENRVKYPKVYYYLYFLFCLIAGPNHCDEKQYHEVRAQKNGTTREGKRDESRSVNGIFYK